MMTPEAVQRYRDADAQFDSIGALICRKIYGPKAHFFSTHLLEGSNVMYITVYPRGEYVGPNERVVVPIECFTSIEKLDAFCAEFIPEHIREERAEFERLRELFCEQPCVDH